MLVNKRLQKKKDTR